VAKREKPQWSDPEMIDWSDHCRDTQAGGWISQSERKPRTFVCRSIGWVINENKKVLQLVPHFGDTVLDDMYTDGVMTIVKAAIISRKKLKLAKR
jgi:hypothetical protein